MTEEEQSSKIDQKEIPLVIPSESPKIYASGAFGGYTPHDFRIFLYSETPLQQDQLLPPGKLAVMREVQSEIVLSPLAAKELSEWLTDKVKNFEKDFGQIPGPNNMPDNDPDD